MPREASGSLRVARSKSGNSDSDKNLGRPRAKAVRTRGHQVFNIPRKQIRQSQGYALNWRQLCMKSRRYCMANNGILLRFSAFSSKTSGFDADWIAFAAHASPSWRGVGHRPQPFLLLNCVSSVQRMSCAEFMLGLPSDHQQKKWM